MPILRTELIIVTFYAAFLSTVPVCAQKADFIDFVPVSPNAAALGKFGDVPVSYYTGIPSIEIPLYSIEQKDIKIPISLSYHAGGIKVSELASWVGLGWTLNAGGAIVRNERGLSDDLAMTGYLKHGKIINESGLTFKDYYDASQGQLDLESDEYFFNFPGGSGRFVLDQQANAIPVPHQQIRIVPLDINGNTFTSTSQGEIRGWKATGMQGIQYFFEAIEETRQIYEFTNYRHTTAWNLTRIVSADQADTIRFHYEDAGFTAEMPISETLKILVRVLEEQGIHCGTGSLQQSTRPYSTPHVFNTKRLKRMEFANGYIDFIPSTSNRCDLPADKLLDRIVVVNDENVTVKEVELNYGYLVGTSILLPDETPCPSDHVRPMLTSLQETGKSPYKFEYIKDKGLPTRVSAAQDHWGFYNREHDYLHTLLPSGIQISSNITILGKEREANVNYGKQGTLKKITYPTGGSTAFEYQANTAILSTLGNFPEFAGGYTSVTNPLRIFHVDYGSHDYEVASLNVNHLDDGTTVSFMTENLVESSGNYFIIKDSIGQEIPVSFSSHDGSKRYYSCVLPNGTYKVIAKKMIGETSTVTGQLYELSILEYNSVTALPSSHLVTIGGLRIKEVTDVDVVSGITHKRKYEYGPGALSGGIKYSSLRKEVLCTQWDVILHTKYSIGEVCVISANSNYPLSNTSGAPVGYSSVTVREFRAMPDNTINDNGYTQYEFTTALDYPDEGFQSYSVSGDASVYPPSPPTTPQLYNDPNSSMRNYQFPYAPPRKNDWKRGLLKSKATMKRTSNGNYAPVSLEKNHYKIGAVPRTIRNVRCGLILDAMPVLQLLDEVAYAYYDVNGQYLYQDKAEMHSYDNLGNDIMTVTEYFYDNPAHLLPTRTVTSTSDGKKVYTATAYPPDYASGTGFIDDLMASNIISVPIESVNCLEDADGSLRVTGGVLNIYYDSGKGLIQNVKFLEVEDDLMADQFRFSNRISGELPTSAASKTMFTPDGRYSSRLYVHEYFNGKVIEQQKSDDVVHSFIWDYRHQYIVAHAINANSQDIAFNGFESEGNGGWELNGGTVNSDGEAVAGINSYTLSAGNSIKRVGIAQGDYIVSYWSRNGSLTVNGAAASGLRERDGWTLYEHKLSNVVSVLVGGTATIDDLRLYPANALMTTYSYYPLIGVRSVSDENNRITYFKYDDAGRLEEVRDDSGNLVKEHKYHYKQ